MSRPATSPRRWRALLATLALAALAGSGCGQASGARGGDGVLVAGERGGVAGRFSFPRGIDVAADGRLAVTDRTGRVQILSDRGEPLTQWMLPKYDNGTPTGIIFDASDPSTTTLLVADTHNSRILRYSLTGRLLGQFGVYGSEPGQMIYPTDIALDADGTMYLAEYGEHDRVMVFTRSGEFVRQFGGFGSEPGRFQRPMALALSPDGRLIVADTCNHRLQVFSPEGELLTVWGGAGTGQFNFPYDIAVDAAGRVLVAEWGNHRVQVLDEEGRTLGLLGGAGAEPGRLGQPWGVAAGRDGDHAWVADTLNHRLQRFELRMVGAGPQAAALREGS